MDEKHQADILKDAMGNEPLQLTEEPPLTPRQRKLTWLFTGISFFAGYIVSAGPAAFVARRFDLPMVGGLIEKLYFPLVVIVKSRVPVLSTLIKAWIDLFD